MGEDECVWYRGEEMGGGDGMGMEVRRMACWRGRDEGDARGRRRLRGGWPLGA